MAELEDDYPWERQVDIMIAQFGIEHALSKILQMASGSDRMMTHIEKVLRSRQSIQISKMDQRLVLRVLDSSEDN